MPSDEQDQPDDVQVSGEIVSEDNEALPLEEPYIGVSDKIALEQWRITRAFNYITLFTVASLLAVVINPTMEVRVVAVAVVVGAFGLARYLLRSAYRSK